MGIFIKVIGCKETPINDDEGEIFRKRLVKCTGCPATYNSRICHRALALNDLSIIFTELE